MNLFYEPELATKIGLYNSCYSLLSYESSFATTAVEKDIGMFLESLSQLPEKVAIYKQSLQ